jgi:hypothetical protein
MTRRPGEALSTSGGLMAKRGETFSIYCGVSPITGVCVHYDRIDPDRPGYWLNCSRWCVPGTFRID